MAEKRRDSKGRVLWAGESQRPDGKYEFKYADNNGERHSVYSWKLVATDRVPEGKQVTESLREMEKQIKKDLEDNLLVYETRKMTLNSFWDEYIALKHELKDSTRSNYIYMYDKYIRPEIGQKNITGIKYSDVKKFYMSLIYEKGFKPNSMEIVNTILHPVFTSAVRDGYIRLNPSDGVMAEIKKSHAWEKPKRHALTERQQELFVNFTAQSHQYDHAHQCCCAAPSSPVHTFFRDRSVPPVSGCDASQACLCLHEGLLLFLSLLYVPLKISPFVTAPM